MAVSTLPITFAITHQLPLHSILRKWMMKDFEDMNECLLVSRILIDISEDDMGGYGRIRDERAGSNAI
jgi:hypothetical protein